MEELTDEQKRAYQEQKLLKFQSMNIPTARVNQNIPTVMTVKNPSALKKLEDIKRGAFKSTFNEIVKKPNMADNKIGMNYEEKTPIPRGSQEPVQQTMKAPTLFEERPVPSRDLDEASILFGDSGLSQTKPIMTNNQQMNYAPGQRVNEIQNDYNDDGSAFVQETRSKFHSNMQQKIRSQQQQYYQQSPVDQYYQQQPSQPVVQPGYNQAAPTVIMPQLQQGLVVFNEEDLKKKIISYATQIAKKVSEQMIKSVLNEYMSQKKNPIVESDNIKKAEVVGENIVKIEGQIFKLVPAAVKTPTKKVSE